MPDLTTVLCRCTNGSGLVAALQNALERVAVIVCELEIGEVGVAYAVATGLEFDLEAALMQAKRQPVVAALQEAA